MKLKSLNFDETEKLKLWWNSNSNCNEALKKTQTVTKLKNSNFNDNRNLELWWNSKFKLWWNSKIQMVTKLKNSTSDKTQNLKLLKPKKNLSCDKTQIVTKLNNGSGPVQRWLRSFCLLEKSVLKIFFFISMLIE